jgi:cytochrome P450
MTLSREYDLYGYKFKGNVFATYADMRAAAPVCLHEGIRGQNGVWFILGYEEAEAVLRDHQRFVKDWRRAVDPELVQSRRPASTAFETINHHLLTVDPPDHTRLRALVNKAFTSRMVSGRRDWIQTVAETLLDHVQDSGEMDAVGDFAYPFAITVIDDFLGVERADSSRLRQFADAYISPQYSGDDFNRIMEEFEEYILATIEQRRRNPRDDLITRLVEAEEEGDRLSARELVGMLALLSVAGFETTASFVGTSILALIQHPELLARMRGDPALAPAAVEELLRYDSPIERAPVRFAAEDVEIAGQTIRKGDPVWVVLAASNRDPSKFGCPDEVDLDRADARHLAFGQGIHFCLGAPLARLEGEIALSTVVRRLPNLRLNAPVERLRWRMTPIVFGLESLPVAWD